MVPELEANLKKLAQAIISLPPEKKPLYNLNVLVEQRKEREGKGFLGRSKTEWYYEVENYPVEGWALETLRFQKQGSTGVQMVYYLRYDGAFRALQTMYDHRGVCPYCENNLKDEPMSFETPEPDDFMTPLNLFCKKSIAALDLKIGTYTYPDKGFEANFPMRAQKTDIEAIQSMYAYEMASCLGIVERLKRLLNLSE